MYVRRWCVNDREKGERQWIYNNNFVTLWQKAFKRVEKTIGNVKVVLSISKSFCTHLFSLYNVILKASTYLWKKWAGLEAVKGSLEINWFWENAYLYIQVVFLILFFHMIFIISEDILKDSKSGNATRLVAVLTAINTVILWQWRASNTPGEITPENVTRNHSANWKFSTV